MAKITGGCQCGAVRYETAADPAFAAHCQCNDCKKATGAGHATAAAFPDAAVTFKGAMTTYESKTDTGGTAARTFCPKCGGRLTFRSTNMPGMVLLMAGSMDDPSQITPGAAIYNKRHLPWDHMDPKLQVAEAMPPR